MMFYYNAPTEHRAFEELEDAVRYAVSAGERYFINIEVAPSISVVIIKHGYQPSKPDPDINQICTTDIGEATAWAEKWARWEPLNHHIFDWDHEIRDSIDQDVRLRVK